MTEAAAALLQPYKTRSHTEIWKKLFFPQPGKRCLGSKSQSQEAQGCCLGSCKFVITQRRARLSESSQAPALHPASGTQGQSNHIYICLTRGVSAPAADLILPVPIASLPSGSQLLHIKIITGLQRCSGFSFLGKNKQTNKIFSFACVVLLWF